jgi:beta-lactamase regulating signal transducer with metallopeptidase domain
VTLLLTWLWQGLAIALATACLLACARRLSAATRHAIWWLAAGAVLALPVVYAGIALRPRGATVPVPAASALPIPAAPDWIAVAAVAAWALFACAGAVQVVRSLLAIRRLKASGRPFDAARASRLPRWSAVADGQLRLAVSDRLRGACALGLGRPTILVGATLVETLDDRELDEIVMHEHAHLARRDDWSQLAQAALGVVVGWHPAIRFIAGRLALEREAACDDRVVGARADAARSYAAALVRAAETAVCGAVAPRAAIPGAFSSPSVLRRRVRRLLDADRDRSSRPPRSVIVTAAAVLAASVGLAARVPAVVVVVERTIDLPFVASVAHRVTAVEPVARVAAPVVDLASAPAARRQSEGVARMLLATQTIAPVSLVARSSAADEVAPAASPDAPIASMPTVSPIAPVPVRGPAAADFTWRTVADSASTLGTGLARAGAATGARAKDAGISIGRFFGRAGNAFRR